MRDLSKLASDDGDMFGPGSDLVISLFAVLLIVIAIGGKLYQENEEAKFKTSGISFSAGMFKLNPVTEPLNPKETKKLVGEIFQEYEQVKSQYPFVFIIGHSNEIDDPQASDKSLRKRLERNWVFAGRRAAVIAGLLQEFLPDSAKNKMVVVSTGEFDMKIPQEPTSQENSVVEVVFGKEWKLPLSTQQNHPLR